MRSVDLSMGTVNSMTHMKTVFSFMPGIGSYFNGKTFCSSDDSVMHLVHILHNFTVNNVLQTSRRKKEKQSYQSFLVLKNLW
jgi:hypothetical protein